MNNIREYMPESGKEWSSFCAQYGNVHVVIIKTTHLNREYSDFGWGNGYVIVPKGHPLYEKDYFDIDVKCHHGLTYSNYSEFMSKHLYNCPDGWMIGFDTAHYQDTLDKWPMTAVLDHAYDLADQVINYTETDLSLLET